MLPHSCNHWRTLPLRSLVPRSQCWSFFPLTMARSRCEGKVCFLCTYHADIHLLSVHSGKMNGLNPQTFAEFDHSGFLVLQDLFVHFGQNIFSK